ncbi:hypothetical protein [Tahibacter soli]|jgi:hypothetical protein|uniref:Uncharacterized protein n=1 Tax=Tahibacter soli TaxID=2983605 RepID=A0A9X4BJ99_9GAMM|nr:hypothetical protein [Tahibacter soli]MDC8013032.1 hypothetical protein [Tahibacter soli]
MRLVARRYAVWIAAIALAAVLAALWMRWGAAIFASSLGGMVC